MATQVGSAYVEIGAKIDGLERGLKDAKRQFEAFAQGADRNSAMVGAKFEALGSRMNTVGRKMTKSLTLPIAAVGTLAVGAAIKFESAFAGVRKTVNATEGEFKKLERGIRDMSLKIPASAESIAQVAEAAGQLGIENKSILKFTRTMIDLGESTNLSSDQAAQSLARLANITSMPQKNFDRLGSTIVALGNNLATTESEITEMGLRIAGAGKQVGLTVPQIMGFAGALSSVGMEAQAGGSAMSRVLLNMQNSAMKGGKTLEAFAKIAGTSADSFSKQFKNAPAQAVVTFVQGLQRIQKSGGNVVEALKSVGITELRVRDGLLRLAGAGNLLTDALTLGSEEWTKNTALAKEAGERYKTAASQLQILRNRAQEIARTFGEALVPFLLAAVNAIEPVAEGMRRLAEGFKELPGPVKLAVGGMIAFVAAMGPLLWMGGKVLSSIAAIKVAMAGMGVASAGTAAMGAAAGGAASRVGMLGGALPLLANPLGLLAGIAVAGAVGLLLFGKNTDVAAARQQNLAAASRDTLAAMGMVSNAFSAQATAVTSLRTASDGVTNSQKAATDANRAYAQAQAAGRGANETEIAYLQRINGLYLRKIQAEQAASAASTNAGASASSLADAFEKTADASSKQISGLEGTRKSLLAQTTGVNLLNMSTQQKDKIAQQSLQTEAALGTAQRNRVRDITAAIGAGRAARAEVQRSNATDAEKVVQTERINKKLQGLGKELKAAKDIKVDPKIELAVDNPKKRLGELRSELDGIGTKPWNVRMQVQGADKAKAEVDGIANIKIPPKKAKVAAEGTDQARSQVGEVVGMLDRVTNRSATVTVNTVTRAGGGFIPGFAGGGMVRGPGGRDRVPAMLTAGEVVLTKRQQAMVDGGMNIRDAIMRTGGAYAKGGTVGAQVTAARNVENNRKKALDKAKKSKDKAAINRAQKAYNDAKSARVAAEKNQQQLRDFAKQAGDAFVAMGLAKFDADSAARLKKIEATFTGTGDVLGKTFSSVERSLNNDLKSIEADFTGTFTVMGKTATGTFRDFEAASRAAFRAFDIEQRKAQRAISATFDALTPAEARLKALNDEAAQGDLSGNLAAAQRELAEATKYGDTEGIVEAQKKLREAERAITISELQKTAEAERSLREQEREAAQDDFNADWEERRATLQNAISDEQALLQGQLNDKIEARRLAAETERAMLQQQLDERLAAEQANDAMLRVQREHALQDEAAKMAARTNLLRGNIKDVLNRMRSFGRRLQVQGQSIGEALASGLVAAGDVVRTKAAGLAKVIQDYLKTSSPTKLGPMSSLDTWWSGLAPALVDGIDTGALEGGIAAAASLEGAVALSGSRMSAAAAGSVINLTVTDSTLAGMSREQADRVASQIKASLDRQIRIGI